MASSSSLLRVEARITAANGGVAGVVLGRKNSARKCFILSCTIFTSRRMSRVDGGLEVSPS